MLNFVLLLRVVLQVTKRFITLERAKLSMFRIKKGTDIYA